MSVRHHLGLWHWRTLRVLLYQEYILIDARKLGSFSSYKIKRHISDVLHMLILAHSTHQSWAKDIHHPTWLELYCPIFNNFPKGWYYKGLYLFLLIYKSNWKYKTPNTTSEFCWQNGQTFKSMCIYHICKLKKIPEFLTTLFTEATKYTCMVVFGFFFFTGSYFYFLHLYY